MIFLYFIQHKFYEALDEEAEEDDSDDEDDGDSKKLLKYIITK